MIISRSPSNWATMATLLCAAKNYNTVLRDILDIKTILCG